MAHPLREGPVNCPRQRETNAAKYQPARLLFRPAEALRAVFIFLKAALSVVILGEYAEQPGGSPRR
jgi:hypothetical protein